MRTGALPLTGVVRAQEIKEDRCMHQGLSDNPAVTPISAAFA